MSNRIEMILRLSYGNNLREFITEKIKDRNRLNNFLYAKGYTLIISRPIGGTDTIRLVCNREDQSHLAHKLLAEYVEWCEPDIFENE